MGLEWGTNHMESQGRYERLSMLNARQYWQQGDGCGILKMRLLHQGDGAFVDLMHLMGGRLSICQLWEPNLNHQANC